MHCTNCATELPPGAMFCGECGRAVTSEARRAGARGSTRRVGELTLEERISNLPEIIFDVPDPSEDSVAPAAALPTADPEPLIMPGPVLSAMSTEPATSIETEWDAELRRPSLEPEREPGAEAEAGPDAGLEQEAEAGPERESDSSTAAEPDAEWAVAPVEVDSLPLYVERVWDLDLDPESTPAVLVADGSDDSVVPDPQPLAVGSSPEPLAASDERCGQCGAPLEARDIFCGECGFVRSASRAAESSPGPVARDTVAYDPFPWGLPPGQPLPDEEAAADRFVDTPDVDDNDTRIVGPRAEGEGERFVLQFSTGESISVSGTGLLGRNPHAEPGEYFDSFVPISDPGRSVSKTHLEFGQEKGSFWVSDRFSGNGTVVREPDQAPRRAEPGKRYRVVRGSRIEIGEQFFIVS